MQNFDLLREVGKTRKPVLLKRGLAATVKDWLLSRRIRAEPGQSRRDSVRARHQDVRRQHSLFAGYHASIPVARQWIAPADHRRSEPRGREARLRRRRSRWPAWPPARTAIIVEVHYCPSEAQCDGPQALLPETFKELMVQLRQIAAIYKKEFAEVGSSGLNERIAAQRRRVARCESEQC